MRNGEKEPCKREKKSLLSDNDFMIQQLVGLNDECVAAHGVAYELASKTSPCQQVQSVLSSIALRLVQI